MRVRRPPGVSFRMRNLIVTAAALAPLMAATGVAAQETVVSTDRTTPIATATANNGAPSNIRISSAGSIAVANGAAVTVNSNNSIDLDSGSDITMAKAADGATGILVNGGTTGSVTVGGAIRITDTLAADDGGDSAITEYDDTDDDGDLDGPLANGTGRYGIRLTGPGTVTGNVLLENTGTINVEGNNSTGIAVESALGGNITSLGSIQMLGNGNYGLRTTAPVSGDVLMSRGAVSVQGENAVGVGIEGNVGGGLQIQSTVSATGYRYGTRPSIRPTDPALVNENTLYLDELDADDTLQGGPAVRVAGNIAQGVLLDVAPSYSAAGATGDDDGDGVANQDEDLDGDGTLNRNDTDRDGDGILDADEGSANIATQGGAPALEIGSTSQTVTIGAVGTGANAYGIVNRGIITGTGLLENVDAQALRIGVAGGQAVTIEQGVNNAGAITAESYFGDATAVRFGSGATTPIIVNSGAITGAAVTENADVATGILIDAGANVATLTNSGAVTAVISGEKGQATAIRDLSGSLSRIDNTGSIIAAISATDDVRDSDDDNTDASDEAVTGRAIAMDLSAGVNGVAVTQVGTPTPAPATGQPAFADTDGDGVSNDDEPSIVGDILFGSGADSLNVQNGVVQGNIAFGNGADALAISGGSVVTGAVSDTDGLLDIAITNGTLDARQDGTTNISNLSVGGDGNLIVNIDPANATNAGFVVSGNANLADGAGLGVGFSSLITDEQRFTIIDANSLTVGTLDQAAIQGNSPYLFVVEAEADVAAGQVYIDARRRTADEAGLITVEGQAYDAIYQALDDNDAILNAFIGQASREDFINLYEQMLPDHSGGPLLSLASGVDAVTRALTGRNASAAPGETSAWVQEINFYADKDKTDTYGFRSEGFGVAGGVERGTGVGAFGLSVAFTSSDLEDPEAEAEEVLSASLVELGLYWRAQGQNWTTWARAAGGYATFDATRRLVGEGLNLSNESSWNGFSLALAGGASYERNFGRLNVRPEVYAEYFGLTEDSRVEEGGGDGFDLEIDERDGHLFAATAAVNIGYGFGQNGWLRPELRVGWRQNISVDPGETIARFASGGSDFRLTPDTIEGGGPIAGLRLGVGNELGLLSIAADAELIEDYVRYTLLLRASFRF